MQVSPQVQTAVQPVHARPPAPVSGETVAAGAATPVEPVSREVQLTVMAASAASHVSVDATQIAMLQQAVGLSSAAISSGTRF